ASVERQQGSAIQGVGARRRRPQIGSKRALHAASAFCEMAAQIPEPLERPYQPRGSLRITPGLEPVKGGPKVVVLPLQPLEPLPGAPAEVRLGFLCEAKEVCGVPPANLVGFVRFLELRRRVLADRLEHPKAVFCV